MELNAFTWIIVTLAVTAWVFILPLQAVATILVLQLVLLLYIKRSKTMLAINYPKRSNNWDIFLFRCFPKRSIPG